MPDAGMWDRETQAEGTNKLRNHAYFLIQGRTHPNLSEASDIRTAAGMLRDAADEIDRLKINMDSDKQEQER